MQNISFKMWAGGITQKLRILSALAKVLSLDFITHIRLLTSACNSSSKISDTLYWSSQAPAISAHIHMDTCLKDVNQIVRKVSF